MDLPATDRGAIVRNALAMLLLLVALLAGGGQGTLGDSATQLLSLSLIALVLWRWQSGRDAAPPKVAWLALLPFCLPLLQLMPLPDAAWLLPRARVELASQLAAAGVEAPSRWTLNPTSTERALYWMLPALAMFWATLQIRESFRVRLVALFLVVACGAVILGIAQHQEGPNSALRLYEITNVHYAVGFYANRNHFAGQLAMALPFVLLGMGWAWMAWRNGTGLSPFWIVGGLATAGLLLLGIGLAGSRAGLGLGLMAILVAVPTAIAATGSQGQKRRVVVVAPAVVLVLVMFAGVFGALQRLDEDPLEDARWQYAEVGARAAAAHAPLGAGLGTFRQAYQPFDVDTAGPLIINHAHSDVVELWMDAGWLAPVIVLPLLVAFAIAGWRLWRHDHAKWTPVSLLLGRAAWIALLGVLLHAVVDYSLRTTSHLAVVGFLAALMIPPLASRKSRRRRGESPEVAIV